MHSLAMSDCYVLAAVFFNWQKQKPARGTARVQQPHWKLARWLGLKAISSAAVTERDAALPTYLEKYRYALHYRV